MSRRSACALVALALAAPAATQARPAAPFLWLRVDDSQALLDSRLGTFVQGIFETALRTDAKSGERDVQRFHELLATLAPPFELWLAADPVVGGPLYVVQANPGRGSTLATVRPLAAADLPRAATHAGEVFGGLVLSRQPAGGVVLLEGNLRAQRLLVLGRGDGDPQGMLDRGLGAITQPVTAMERLKARCAPGAAQFACNCVALGDQIPLLEAPGLQPMVRASGVLKAMFGPRFVGFSGSVTVVDRRLHIEMLVDWKPGQGVVGGLVEDWRQPVGLLRLLPKDAQEFFAGRLSPKGVAGLLETLGRFGVPLDPGQWDPVFAPWAGLDFGELVEEHLTGEVLALVTPSRKADAVDPESDEPFVLCLGSHDGGKLLKRLESLVATLPKELGLELRAATAGPATHTLAAGDEVILCLAVAEGHVALLSAHEDSLALLQRLQGDNAARGIPERLVQLLGEPVRTRSHAFTWLGHAMSQLSGQVFLRDLQGRPGSATAYRRVADQLERAFPGDTGFGACEAWFDERGLRLRIVQ